MRANRPKPKKLTAEESAAREERYHAAVKRWEAYSKPVFDAADASERITAADLAIVINARADKMRSCGDD